MSFVMSMCWLQRGVAKTPTKLKIEKDELEKIIKSKPKDKKKKKNKNKKEKEVIEEEKEEETKEIEEENDDNDDVSKKYGLDDYDNESSDIRAEDISALTCFASNNDDLFLTIKDEGEDSDGEDFEIKASDNLLVCGQADKEVCTLNAYVYNEFDPCFYIHHDIILPSYPLCVEWLDYDSTSEKSNEAVNYLAIGTLNPWIEIWDLDVVDTLEPEFILAPEKTKKKSKKAANKMITKINGHKDAVLDLSWNKLNRNVIASGSADQTIVLWDLDTLKQAIKIKHHTDKVQSVNFHPIETFSLLSGSFDQTVALFDCRNPTENFKTWNFETGDVEKAIWNHHSPNQFLASTEQGFVYVVDIRQEKPLITMQAHESSVSGLTLSSRVPGLLVTASADELVKVWDIKEDSLELVFQKKLNLGSLNCAQSSPDSQFVFAFGGELSNEPYVWDIRTVKNVRDTFYPRMNIEFTKEDLEEDKIDEESDAENENDDDENGDEDGEMKNKKRTKKFKKSSSSSKKKDVKKPKKAFKKERKIKQKK